ncbi:MAG: hypothetical protein ABSB80_00110 [Methanoregula sp.]|jgi:hypothetical protein|uniref:hypothetical protein n=1 Tax=Methanoregula sp. TaxID=2052170 RepID=UPI003D1028E4
MIPNYSTNAPFLFIASITAAALMYATSNIAFNKLSKANEKFLSISKNFMKSAKNDEDHHLAFSMAFGKFWNKKIEETVSNYKKANFILLLDVILFLVTNILIIIYWTSNIDIIVNFAVVFYIYGIFVMIIFIFYSLVIWNYYEDTFSEDGFEVKITNQEV